MMKLVTALTLMSVFLCGCAGGPQPSQNPDQLKATHGFVRVTLPLGDPQSRVSLRGGDGAEHELQRNEALGDNVFGLWLPAGSYSFSELTNQDGSKYLPVQVNVGQLTELGGLVPIQLGGYEEVTLPIRHADIDADSARALAQLSPHLTAHQVLAWQPHNVPKHKKLEAPSTGLGLIADLLMDYERHVNKPTLNKRLKEQTDIDAMYRLALTAMPPQMEEPAVDGKGNIYFGGELGQVRVRGSEGSWTNLDTGTLQAITAVASHGVQLVVGTARGAIRTSLDGGKTWKQVAAIADGEAVMDIDRVGSRWIVLTSKLSFQPMTRLKMAGNLHVYAAADDEWSGLENLRQISLPGPMPLIQSWAPKGQAWASRYYVNGVTELLQLDTESMQWKTLKLPHNATTVNVSKDGGAIAATLIQGAFSKLDVSTDGGATWLRRDTPRYPIYDVNFNSATAGLATRWNTGMFTSSIEFMQYDAAKDRWDKTRDAPAGCVRVLRDALRVQRYCLSSGGSILNYVGGKWMVEFAAN